MGAGEDRNALMTEAAELVQAGVVDFPPAGLEALPAIASADIGLLLSNATQHAEGCSNAIMEYMACGLPVVCTDSGGNPELVEDGVNGLLVAPGDTAALVRTLRALRDDPTLAARMGAEGRARVASRFCVEEMAAGFVAVYERLLAPTRPRS
jgi:glycosyltransferase involved in cell wall biosynthesis